MFENTDDKLNWIRNNWEKLKDNGKLYLAVEKVVNSDNWLKENYTVQDVIDLEECMKIPPVNNVRVKKEDKYPANPF